MSSKINKLDINFLTLFIIVFYVLVQVLSNIASSKIAFVFNLAVDGGTFLYPLAFTLRDLVHKKFGKKTTLNLIFISAIINIFTPLFFYFIAALPADSTWNFNKDFSNVLSPILRISLASIVAGTISELTDTQVYHIFVTKITKKFQWLRVLISNAVSIPIDTLIFVVIAFLGVLEIPVIIDIFIFNFMVKYAVSIFTVPLIYIVPEREK